MTAEHTRSAPRPGAGSQAPRPLVLTLVFIALMGAAVGSLGAPLITAVAAEYEVSLAAAQWTLTVTLLSAAVLTPLLGRLGTGRHRRATVLGTLLAVVAGSLLTVLPAPFPFVLIGRALQGAGAGLTALMMGIARDHLPPERSRQVIAMISVASTVGIGVGYPMTGFLTDVAGLRGAYALGLAVAVIALAGAWVTIPGAPAGRAARLDVPGVLLLSGGLLAVLLDVSQTALWSARPVVALSVAVAGVLLLAAWTWRELRTGTPLIDLRLLRHRSVAAATLAMALAGTGMYLLLALATRFAQTPESSGYGFGLSMFWAGLALVPFSLMGFVAAKLHKRISTRLSPSVMLTAGALVVLIAFVVFLTARSGIVGLLASIAVLGFGVSTFSATMPGIILAVTPQAETSSAMAFNQVVRSVFFSFGSAVAGLMLAAHTPAGRAFPTDQGYATAAVAGVVLMALTALTVVVLLRTEREPS